MLRFRVVSVDQHGFLGRDFHPDKKDEGLVVTAVKMNSQYFDKRGYVEDVFNEEDGRLYEDALPLIKRNVMDVDDNQIIQMWSCVTEDGRVLELLTHEIEIVLDDDILQAIAHAEAYGYPHRFRAQ